MLKIKIFIVLLLALSFTGFICNKDEDDDKTCGDAAANMTNIIWDAYSGNIPNICTDVAYYTEQWVTAAECEFEVNTKSDAVEILTEACKDNDLTQSDIDCIAGADTVTELEYCAE